MNDVKKSYLYFAILTLVALVLAACGGAPPAPAVPTAATGQPAQPGTATQETPAAQPQPTPADQSQNPPSAATNLGGKVWQWTKSTFNDGKTTDVSNPANYTIEFSSVGGMVSVKADCNMVSGSYTTEGNNLTITLGPSTMAMCPPESQDQEFIRQLGLVAQYLMQGETLVLNFKADSGGMTFVPAAAQATQPTQPAQPAAGVPGQDLGGKEWQWVKTVTNDGQTFNPTNPADYTVQFAMADGKVAIKADCNNAEGEFMTDGQNIQIMIGGVTRAMCPPGSLSDEFLKELSEASSYKADGNTLTLTLSNGTMTLSAGQAATTPPAQGGTPASLERSLWKWVNTTSANGSTVTAPNPEQFTLRFGQVAQRFTFVADCNNGSGSYTVNGQALTMKVEGMTRAFCPPPSDEYVQQLGQVTSYKIDGNKPQLALGQNAGTMTFTTDATTPAAGGGNTPATPATPATASGSNKQRLTSGVWKWQQSADNAGQTWTSPTPANYTIEFKPIGAVTVKADCNTSNGTYQADESSLTITLGPTTMMACAPGSLDSVYLKQLGDVSSYFFDGNNLILLWKMDTGSMKFSQ